MMSSQAMTLPCIALLSTSTTSHLSRHCQESVLLQPQDSSGGNNCNSQRRLAIPDLRTRLTGQLHHVLQVRHVITHGGTNCSKCTRASARRFSSERQNSSEVILGHACRCNSPGSHTSGSRTHPATPQCQSYRTLDKAHDCCDSSFKCPGTYTDCRCTGVHRDRRLNHSDQVVQLLQLLPHPEAVLLLLRQPRPVLLPVLLLLRQPRPVPLPVLMLLPVLAVLLPRPVSQLQPVPGLPLSLRCA